MSPTKLAIWIPLAQVSRAHPLYSLKVTDEKISEQMQFQVGWATVESDLSITHSTSVLVPHYIPLPSLELEGGIWSATQQSIQQIVQFFKRDASLSTSGDMGEGIRSSTWTRSSVDIKGSTNPLASRHPRSAQLLPVMLSHLQVPRLRVILEISRSSMHRLQVHRAGMVELSMAGSIPLAERSELLKAYRARWESLRWTKVTCLRSNNEPCPQFIGTTLVRAEIERPVVTYHQLPLGGAPESPLETHHLCLSSRGTIMVISTCPRTNLLAIVTEEWIENTGW